MFLLRRPDRRSSAGVWIAPPDTTTALARTVSSAPLSVTATTPSAVPPRMTMRRTSAPTTSRAPRAAASASQVLVTDCLAPTRQP
ncbi:Uncharacterised protein [Mycobacteroides abscessus subsp. abscessus]|nr:Uncharacterised protein [Mycobacteroides abscessus subsp. abscessus]